MKKLMRITGPVTYVNYDGRQAVIPPGQCTVDYGVRKSEVVIVSWRRRESVFAIEITLTELAVHVADNRIGSGGPVAERAWTRKTIRIRRNPEPDAGRGPRPAVK